jgi:hypothetical protein
MVKLRGMRWAEQMARMAAKMNAYRVFFCGKARNKRPLGRSTRAWEDNIKMHLPEIE